MQKTIITSTCLLIGVLSWFFLAGFQENEPFRIEIDAIEGLQFSPVRFAVKPGQEVELVFRNRDDMMHNLLITQPGAREEVAELGLASGMAENFVPDTNLVLWATEVISYGETQTIRFTAPDDEGEYPYVCTFPGHPDRMFGVMYVTSDETSLPELSEDPNIPEYLRDELETDRDRLLIWEHNPADAPRKEVRRTFIRDAGPSAIGVHAGRNLSFIWDADTAHLRYAWWGGFLDSEQHWTGNQSDFSEVEGHIYYRALREFPIRLGETSYIPSRSFLGYELIDELPGFEYYMDQYRVHQYISSLPDDTGLRMEFEIQDIDQPVYFVTDLNAGAEFRSSAGEWDNGVLKLSAEEAEAFSIDFIERPEHEPIGYWSMNDDPWTQFQNDRVREGVVGRSLHFEEHEKLSKIYGDIVDPDMTFAGWVKIQDSEKNNQFIFGQRDEDSGREFSLLFHDGLFKIHYPDEYGEQNSENLSASIQPGEWNHFMWTRSGSDMEVFVNGNLETNLRMGTLLYDQPFTIGASNEEYHMDGYLDQILIWRRVLNEDELNSLYEKQADHLNGE
ncbi:hypothetical protein DYD21_05490 [Rhodohalobacter sp. SW132]|uniref:LamG-like jellyroll fold domain-containing protein n=1 Tax=Rhodohalobacter sp. SW132 TaxID=2293433 RepID=UPI000E25D442|nr:LamG-like jellyroll fold domain-containing protein [Rhodohalobacter sp. SW132]REL38067.1 hypothetical protein DYD21_05490 [Rhodohalobacter sp. SW132]